MELCSNITKAHTDFALLIVIHNRKMICEIGQSTLRILDTCTTKYYFQVLLFTILIIC